MVWPTKIDIVATIGPKSWADSQLEQLMRRGVAVFRFPFSKETPEHHAAIVLRVRALSARLGLSVKCMADLPGGKPRLDNATIKSVQWGHRYKVAMAGGTRTSEIDFTIRPPMRRSFTIDDNFTIGDGPLTFSVEAVDGDVATGFFDADATLQPTRGFLPRDSGAIASFTDADMAYAEHASKSGFDMVALSFVASDSDVVCARSWFRDSLDWTPTVIAKIETPAGVEHIADIAKVCDQVMIARGDLAITVGLPNLWHAQRGILRECLLLDRYAIIATGLLECGDERLAMTQSHSIDIMASIEMGASALMLSGETTIGRDPAAAVDVLLEHVKVWQAEGAARRW